MGRTYRLSLAFAALVVLLLTLVLQVDESRALLWGSNGGDNTRAVTKTEREQQIALLEEQLRTFNRRQLNKAHARLYNAQAALMAAKRREGFFYTDPKDKATIRLLDEEYNKALVEVETLRRQENKMLAKLKPLYGIVSTQFAQEQKHVISESIAAVQKMSYDSAWYNSLFNLGEAESFSDIIIGFLVQWVLMYIILYPFALLYYALWAAPWSVYAYSSGLTDIVPGTIAYILSVTVMSLPLVSLLVGFYLFYRHYSRHFAATMRAANRAGYHFHED